MSESVLLRTLTEKSKLKFGKYQDHRIGDLLKLRTTKNYLIWVYYNFSMINFTDSVLTSLWINEDQRIKKPGVKRGHEKVIYEKYKKYVFARILNEKGRGAAFAGIRWSKKSMKAKQVMREIMRERSNSKNKLAEKNRNGISPSVSRGD